MFDQILEQS